MRSASLVVLVAIVAVTGCGSKYNVVPAGGRITFNGEPMSGVTILTQPVSSTAQNNAPGPGSYGHTDSDGRFSLELQNEPTPGAVPGKCLITIVEKAFSQDATSDVVTREDRQTRVPMEYRANMVTFEIPAEGTDAMDFDLKSERRRR